MSDDEASEALWSAIDELQPITLSDPDKQAQLESLVTALIELHDELTGGE